MDNFHNYRAPRRTPSAMDGFVRVGGNQPKSKTVPVSHPVQNRLDVFGQSDGFKPNVQPKITAGTSQVKANAADTDLRVSPSDMHAATKKPKTSKKRRWPRVLAKTFLALFLVGLLGGGYFAGRAYLAVHGILKGGGSAPALAQSIEELKGEGDGRVNVLLLGVGGDGHDGPDLTDTMILASIDPVNKKASLLSIPRDLWVKMPNNYVASEHKINAAYESGKYAFLGSQDGSNKNKEAIKAGFKAADGVVETVLGVPVHYNVLIDFKAFEKAIDTVGGVSVNVPEALVDPTMAWENNWDPVLAKQGQQSMKGKQALMYVRSRETSSDFARSQRQRAVMVGLKEKAFSLGTLSNPVKVSSLIGSFGDNVVSDISTGDAMRMADLMKDISNDKIQSVGLTDDKNNLLTSANVGGLSVIKPKAGAFNYTDIQSYARNILKDGYIQKEDATINVFNGSSITGLAAQKANDLKSYGYNILTVGNAPKQNYANTILVDLSGGQKKVTLKYLEQRFGVKAVTTVPDTSITTTGADFVIILGQNEKQSP